ncbi:MAG: hypothetical protein ABEK50_15525 [bacterium]
MAWINEPNSNRRSWLRLLIVGLIGFMIIGGSFAVTAKMKALDEKEMREVRGGEGLGFTLKDFHVTGNGSIEFFQDDRSCCDGGLLLENLNLHEPGAASNGVTTGSLGDPITLDVGGSHNGVVVMELPDNKSNMERNTFIIGGQTDAQATDDIWFTEEGDGGKNSVNGYYNFGGLRLKNAQYAGGTRVSFAGTPDGEGGGLRLGLILELNGDLDFNDPTGAGFAFNGIHGAANETDSDDQQLDDGDFSGPLRWACLQCPNLSGGKNRPLVLNFQEEGGDGEFMLEFNPAKNNPVAGHLGVEKAWFSGTSYGEILIGDIRIKNLQVRHNENIDGVSHDLGGYTAPNH